MKRHRRANVFAVFCALTSVFLVLHGCGGDGGDSAPSVTVPVAPSNLVANAGDNSVTLSWSAVTGATSYNLYWDTASGVKKATATKIAGVTSPKDVTGLANYTRHYFIVTAVNANGESTESAEVFATPVAPSATFIQDDLTGTWDYINFSLGNSPGTRGWSRAVLSCNSSGGLTVISNLNNDGDTSVPPANWVTLTISSSGVVSDNSSTSGHTQMSSNKLLLIGTDHGAMGNWTDISVGRKRTPTVSFVSGDLANKTFRIHSLLTGTDNSWSHMEGATDGSGLVTITSFTDPSGTDNSVFTAGTLSVSSTGIVTLSGDPTFYGLMTDDKKVIFYIDTLDIDTYEFGVITITGQTYTQADLAGTLNFFSIRNTVPKPFWGYGATVIDTAGNGTYLSYTDSAGGPTPAAYTRVLEANGVTKDPEDDTHHGQLSYNKDISVRTNTSASGRYGLTISFK